ncbi:hypothetical protein M427DRAFT_191866 [Gonapodya prolifera JEL478]|uniref:Sulfhydryl oxidase n=1 Tax=Gonapodya prolifera (strain JEL478) TaxID=1344416 RepID=A0A139A164_GONPJ|nr:hypothetical protein M427DRAFT_191866 [Gonapodya prolifera JEL478]|eukprot:KXS10093.1 hypothetical protein M427DRAFT_191866 [Gonapodya prolifera JEL478]
MNLKPTRGALATILALAGITMGGILLYTTIGAQEDSWGDLEADNFIVSPELQHSVMGKMENQTARAELGRAFWRVLHTMTMQFPEEPTPNEQESLRRWIILSSKLYPCGECSEHFIRMVRESPPNVTTRYAVANWACDVHNRVNEHLRKPIFDCTKLKDVWGDCGCKPKEKESK